MSDPNNWQVTNYGANVANLFNPTDSEGTNYYYDPQSGNLYDAQDPNANIVASKAALEFNNQVNNQGGGDQNNFTLYSDPKDIQAGYDLYQSDPHAYNAKQAQALADQYFNLFTTNGHGVAQAFGAPDARPMLQAQIDAYKTSDPNAYYNAMLSEQIREAGWDAGQNKTNPETQASINNLAKEALANGMTADQIQSLIANNYAGTANAHAANIANRAQDQGTLNGLPQFAALSLALGSGLGAGIGALGLGAEAAGAGAGGFGLTASSVPSLAGGLSLDALPASTAIGGYGSIAAPSLAGSLALNGGFAGADSLAGSGGFGLTAADVPSLAGNLGDLSASTGMGAKDVLSNLQSAKQVYGLGNTLANLLRGGNSKSSPLATNETSQQQIAQYLNNMSPAQEQFGGLYESNKNPFSFTQQQPIQISQNKISSLLRS
jgi:hypothetical protein